jgi:predicted amidohydrolase YtcJ
MAKPWLNQSEDGSWSAPAFVDRHCHPLFAEREASAVDLTGCNSIVAIQTVLRAHLDANPHTEWLDAAPFDRSMADSFMAQTLDEVSRQVTITLHSSDHHALWVNSAALSIAGLHQGVPELADGTVVCDANGAASGLLLEWSAMKLVLDKQPRPSLRQDMETLERAQRRLLSKGIVAVSDAWIDPGMGEVYLAAAQRKKILMPVELWVRVSPAEIDGQLAYLKTIVQQHKDSGNPPLVKFAGVKIFLDGVLSSRTAALLEPYRDETRGNLIWTDEALDDLIARVSAISPDLRPHFHAVGDAAVRQAIEAITRAKSIDAWTGARKPVIAHAELVSDVDASRLRELDVEVVISPQWMVDSTERQALSGILSDVAKPRVGDFTNMLEAGVRLTFGSDWPVSQPDPLDAVIMASRHLVCRGYSIEKALEASWMIASAGNLENLNGRPIAQCLRIEQNPIEIAHRQLEDLKGIRFRLEANTS